MKAPSRAAAIGAASLVLAAGAGYLTAHALGATAAPARTVTVNVGTGQRGPQGPPGPAGPAGMTCPAGYDPGALVINHPGGQVKLWACLAAGSG